MESTKESPTNLKKYLSDDGHICLMNVLIGLRALQTRAVFVQFVQNLRDSASAR